MPSCIHNKRINRSSLASALILSAASAAFAQPHLAEEELIRAGGTLIAVPGYSVPSFVHWNEDDLKDLVIGEGSGLYTPKVRVYLNVGTPEQPEFDDFFYVQSDGRDLTLPGGGCLGVFPRVVYWDADNRKDLLIGAAEGQIRIYLNVGTNDAPVFDAGRDLEVGPPGSKTPIDVGQRTTSSVVDYDSDGRKDIVVGAKDARVRVFINEGTDTEPDFRAVLVVQENGGDLLVPSARSSPAVIDLNDDGMKDLLAGNTEGQLLFYANVGTDAEPVFSGFEYVEADGVPIDLPGTPRSRPFVCDWTGDGLTDVLIGSGDGTVRLYRGVSCLADVNEDGGVGFEDLLAVLAAWGPCEDCREDLDADGDVGFGDLLILLSAWGSCF